MHYAASIANCKCVLPCTGGGGGGEHPERDAEGYAVVVAGSVHNDALLLYERLALHRFPSPWTTTFRARPPKRSLFTHFCHAPPDPLMLCAARRACGRGREP